jgi:hypothetical protein
MCNAMVRPLGLACLCCGCAGRARPPLGARKSAVCNRITHRSPKWAGFGPKLLWEVDMGVSYLLP